MWLITKINIELQGKEEREGGGEEGGRVWFEEVKRGEEGCSVGLAKVVRQDVGMM